MPGALIGTLFVTNRAEASLADSRRGEEAMAAGIAHAARQYLSALTSATSGSNRNV